ncbi:MAG: hypothetical protein AB9828_05465 [Sphaerochaetaceae bacterium]
MKTVQKYLICLVLMFLSLSSIGATVTWDPYLGFSKGKAKIEEEQLSFYELSLGTSLGSRGAIEVFLIAQPLSENILNSFDVNNLETVSTSVFMTGIKTSLTLFKDAFFNPMIQAGLGQMLITSFESSGDEPDFLWYFYSSVATGFEVDFGDSFKIHLLSGYRFAPHDQVMDTGRNALSSKFSSIDFRVQLH